MLLCAHGLYSAKRTEPGLESFALLRTLLAFALLQNFLMPCNRTRPPSFCPFSPEASRLTGKEPQISYKSLRALALAMTFLLDTELKKSVGFDNKGGPA